MKLATLFALLTAVAYSAPAGEDKSWQGSAATIDGQQHTGKLLFAKGKILVDPGTPEEKELVFDQIKQIRFHDAENAGNRPAGKRKFQNGLFGEYFNGTNFDRDRRTRIDRTIDFPWRHDSPIDGIDKEKFSVRWTGEVRAPISGKVKFHTRSDDGSRVWVNGKQIVNGWSDHSESEFSGEIELEEGKRYPIRVEYYDNTSDAVIKLFWSGPSLPRNAIPASHLFTDGIASTAGGGGGNHKIWLRGGSKLKGTVLRADDKFIEVSLRGGIVRLPIPAVAVVEFLGWWQEPEEIAGRPEGVMMRKGGDFHGTKIEGVDDGGMVHTFSPLFGERSYKTADLRALNYGEWKEKPAGQFHIWTHDWGYIIRADAIISKGARLIVRDNSGQYLNLPLSIISNIQANSEKIP